MQINDAYFEKTDNFYFEPLSLHKIQWSTFQ